MRKLFVSIVVVLGLFASFSVSAEPSRAHTYVKETETLVKELFNQDSKRVYRDSRLEAIYEKLRAAAAVEQYEYDANVPIRVNSDGLTGALGNVILYSEEMLRYTDDVVAFLIAHEMGHILMNDQEAEIDMLLAVADASAESVPTDAKEMVEYVAKARDNKALPVGLYHTREFRADSIGVKLARAAGYQPTEPMMKDFFSNYHTEASHTHPSMQSRLSNLALPK